LEEAFALEALSRDTAEGKDEKVPVIGRSYLKQKGNDRCWARATREAAVTGGYNNDLTLRAALAHSLHLTSAPPL
jgi:hypothetical protein